MSLYVLVLLLVVAFAAFFTGAAWGVSVEARYVKRMFDEMKRR